MFTIVKNREFTHKVEVQVPVDGGFETEDFRCKFRVLPADQLENVNFHNGKKVVEVLKAAIVGFGDDLINPEGDSIPFNDANVDAMLADLTIRQGLIDTYLASLSRARSGN